jgi:DNA-binding XRE family transcriptional regulator
MAVQGRCVDQATVHRVRRLVMEGHSKSDAARLTGLSRPTVNKIAKSKDKPK